MSKPENRVLRGIMYSRQTKHSFNIAIDPRVHALIMSETVATQWLAENKEFLYQYFIWDRA